MNVLIVGSGAREDALSWGLAQSASCSRVFAAPGNAGTASRGENWPIAVTQGRALVERAKANGVDLAVIGPETAIAASLGDRLREAGIATFGPGRSAGRLESSKVFAKRFMERAKVPTARFRVVHSAAAAHKELARWQGGCVVKADGLAGGKGVVVCDDARTALEVVEGWYAHGIPGGGSDVVLEQRLAGREVSIFAIGDGSRFVPIGAACDYKRAFDGDEGPNTGGMGAYSPPNIEAGLFEEVERAILRPVSLGLAASGERYRGVLYCGLMLTPSGPSVLEFNVRFGDPETQALVPRISGDFARLLRSAADGALDLEASSLSGDPCVAVVLATQDYPSTSVPAPQLPAELPSGDAHVFWGVSSRAGASIDSAGGRVMTVAATGSDLGAARERAYSAVRDINAALPQPLRWRSDIALSPAPLAS